MHCSPCTVEPLSFKEEIMCVSYNGMKYFPEFLEFRNVFGLCMYVCFPEIIIHLIFLHGLPKFLVISNS